MEILSITPLPHWFQWFNPNCLIIYSQSQANSARPTFSMSHVAPFCVGCFDVKRWNWKSIFPLPFYFFNQFAQTTDSFMSIYVEEQPHPTLSVWKRKFQTKPDLVPKPKRSWAMLLLIMVLFLEIMSLKLLWKLVWAIIHHWITPGVCYLIF